MRKRKHLLFITVALEDILWVFLSVFVSVPPLYKILVMAERSDVIDTPEKSYT